MRIHCVAVFLGSWGTFYSSGMAQDITVLDGDATDTSMEVVEVERISPRSDMSVVHVLENTSSVLPLPLMLELETHNSVDNLADYGDLMPASAMYFELHGNDNVSPRDADDSIADARSDENEDELEATNAQSAGADESEEALGDDELGILRLRSQPIGDDELGVLRIRPTEDVPLEVEPKPTRQNSVFLTGRANVYGGNNLFRTPNPIDDRIYQTGIGIFAFPRLTPNTNLVLSAEANVARYEDLSIVDYNEFQFQAGIRQRLGKSSYGQINWRYQDLSTPGSDSFFTANYLEVLLSRRDILNNHTWLDSYYQARLSVSDPKEFSRFTQIATASLNYGFDPKTRVSLLYQLFLDDYTETSRYDVYHQVLAQFSHDLSSTTRVSLFTGVRFGNSSRSNVNFDDTVYGASINVNVPLF